ncbi:hypothetical protein E9531_13970 [Lampropedia puyangensis]|uniref:Uncharacterized protein n=1 Tax=Lampropedia puyangensis TaxID=1330072 RepID=A0A4S8EVV3_9BURK|nr:DUF6882 domain-containing protein [Lampropedia puyangensis]THT98676.1 hypothetical protein E9531_13970 [Lampropedia puyangensis]
MTTEKDWTQWSKDAVNAMFESNKTWQQRFALQGAPYRWDLNAATLTFDSPLGDVVATVCLVGTTSRSGGTFLWAWANDAIPAQHGQALAAVREFGETHGLALLTTPEISGGQPEALECLCIAGRLQNALGTFVDEEGDVTLYFTLLHFQMAQPPLH